ncbi:hypothetical protein FM120_22970 [Sphingobacterium faecium PCAi_F2.5]|nr:hypothetical protein FM120_22970 [Sphingobacterium faecium PCAi_F2.5]
MNMDASLLGEVLMLGLFTALVSLLVSIAAVSSGVVVLLIWFWF